MRQPRRPADWAGQGNSCAIPGAEHSLGPGGAGAGKGGGRGPHPPQQLLTQEHSHCHPPSFLAFIISCNISESSFYIWHQRTRPRWQISNPSTASRPFEKGFKGNVSGDQTMI